MCELNHNPASETVGPVATSTEVETGTRARTKDIRSTYTYFDDNKLFFQGSAQSFDVLGEK